MLALFLFVLNAFATGCPGVYGTCPTSSTAGANWCEYTGAFGDAIICWLDDTGSPSAVGGVSASDWYVIMDGPTDGEVCCDSTSFGGTGDDVIIELDAICNNGSATDCDVDFSAFGATPYLYVYGSDGNDTIRGGAGDDYVEGNDGDDDLYGNGGEDWLFGLAGDDYIAGGTGADFYLFGGADSDFIDGGPGDDRICVGDFAGAATNDCATTGGGYNNQVLGGSGSDIITGSGDISGAGDTLKGGDDSDSIDALAGADTLCGGDDSAVDTLTGGAGDDFLYGGAGSDVQNGGLGTDRCENDGTPTACESPGAPPGSVPYTGSCPAFPAWR
jgi:Ca2+-binding RTX toxin-like protein